MITAVTDELLAAAVAAAVGACARFGLPADEPEVLKDGSNVLVKLGRWWRG